MPTCLLLLALAVGATPPPVAGVTSSVAPMPIATLEVQGHGVLVEMADSPSARAQGLMYRQFLGADQGMLFVYPSADMRAFWMANTTIPLSIAFIGADGVVVSIRDMQPLDRGHTWSGLPALYALEVNQGWFAQHDIQPGARVEGLPGPSRE